MDLIFQTKSHQQNIIDNIITSAKQGFTEATIFSYEQLKIDEITQINSGITRLIIASIRGETNIITSILNSESIDVDYINYKSKLLMFASFKGHQDTVAFLLSQHIFNVNVNDLDSLGKTALIYSASNGHVETLKILLSNKCITVNIQDNEGKTALHHAVNNGHTSIVNALLTSEYININIKDKDLATPLIISSLMGHKEILISLIKVKDIKINEKNNFGMNAFNYAVSNNELEIVNILSQIEEMEINNPSNDGYTPLMHSMLLDSNNLKRYKIVDILLDNPKIDVSLFNDYNENALMILQKQNIDKVIKEEIEEKLNKKFIKHNK